MIIQEAHEKTELGCRVGVPHWNKGDVFEAVRAVIDCGFGAPGLYRIQARHLAHNPASGRVPEQAGQRRVGFSPIP